MDFVIEIWSTEKCLGRPGSNLCLSTVLGASSIASAPILQELRLGGCRTPLTPQGADRIGNFPLFPCKDRLAMLGL